jgi:hypothetical protein
VGFDYAQRLTEILVHNVHQMVHKSAPEMAPWVVVSEAEATLTTEQQAWMPYRRRLRQVT